ncbi:hypothetical protein WDW86_18290, partial [Bdellovibrionota bacterium FG-2]
VVISPLPPKNSSKVSGGCFTAIYKHQVVSPSHRSKEECVQHRNGLKFPPQVERASLNPKSVCVKVDGKPVAYEVSELGVAFGPLAGPRSTVQLTFGTKGAKCKVPCIVPRDSFLESLGASGVSGAANAVGDDPEIRAELGPELVAAIGMGHDLALFPGWVVESLNSTQETTP